MVERALIKASRRRSKIVLSRIGEEVTVRRPAGTATENKFGKVSDADITWEEVATDEIAYRAYPGDDDEPNRARASGGRVRTDDPNILLEEGTQVQEGDRLEFDDGEVYEIDRLFERGAHNETRVTRVQP